MRHLVLVAALIATPAIAAPGECYRDEVHGTVRVKAYIGDRQCIRFDEPAHTMRGIWMNQFEGSAFIENAADPDGARVKQWARWFSYDSQTVWPEGFVAKRGHAYRMTLVGREVVKDKPEPLQGYGHMGLWPGLVLADRIVAIEDLGPIDPR